ncbi:hypothetical protein NQ318_016368 [Aromia moschata]|uniref:Uncharacterized protein n=1 Tax=Aromia moschata TaxID=1265417 RepID=A0AAV8Z5I0_9CUCU|nr:hypothetical protein NQ318_016368 [Aromia moschata]
MAGIRVLQANLQHSRAASVVLTVAMRDFDVVLIQKPWINRGKIMGRGGIGGELIYSRSSAAPRTCILVKKHIKNTTANQFLFKRSDSGQNQDRGQRGAQGANTRIGIPSWGHQAARPTQEAYRNPRKTDWEAYRADLEHRLKGMKQTIQNSIDLEVAEHVRKDDKKKKNY